MFLLLPMFAVSQETLIVPLPKIESNKNPNFVIKESAIIALAIFAGFKRHERDVIDKAYLNYKAVWPNANDQWANPELGKHHKYKQNIQALGYKEILPGIRRPVMFSDKYHFITPQIRLSYSLIIGGSMSLWKKPTLKQIFLQTAVIFVADAIGNGISTKIYNY